MQTKTFPAECQVGVKRYSSSTTKVLYQLRYTSDVCQACAANGGNIVQIKMPNPSARCQRGGPSVYSIGSRPCLNMNNQD